MTLHAPRIVTECNLKPPETDKKNDKAEASMLVLLEARFAALVPNQNYCRAGLIGQQFDLRPGKMAQLAE